MKSLKLLIIFLGIPLLFDCLAMAGTLDQVVAEMGDRRITQWDINNAGTRFNGQGDPSDWLTAVARDALGAMKAQEANLVETSPELKWRLWSLENSSGIDAYLQSLVGDVTVEEDAVRNYYEENNSQFREPASFSFYYIFCDTTEIKTSAGIEEIRSQITKTYDELVDHASPSGAKEGIVDHETFKTISQNCECGSEEGAHFAGPLGLEEPIQDIIKDTALSLKPNQISSVISTKYGFQILLLQNMKEERILSDYEQIKDRIRQFLEGPLKQEKIQEYIAQIKDQPDRYQIHQIQMEHQLPGAHHSTPISPYVVEIGGTKWDPQDFKVFMRSVHRQDWMMSHTLDKANETTWQKLVLPTLLNQEAKEAGFVDQPTQIAQLNQRKEQLLSYYWVMATAGRIVSEMPKPTTEEYRAYYDAHPEKFIIPPRFKIQMIEVPVSATDTEHTPAEKEFEIRELESRMKEFLGELVKGASSTIVLEEWSSKLPAAAESTEWYYENRKLSPEIWSTIESTGINKWLPKPFRTQNGVGVLRVLETRESFEKPFDPSLPTIAVPVKQARFQKVIQETWKNLEEEAKGLLTKLN